MRTPSSLLAAGAIVALGAAPAAPEPRPEHLGTPATSAKAAPAWFETPDRHLARGQIAYAPQSDDVLALLKAAPEQAAQVGPLRDVALACDLDVGDRNFDGLAPFASESTLAADLCMVAGVVSGKEAPRLVSVTVGSDDSNFGSFLLPLVSLDPGAALSIRLVDIDVTFDDPIETVRVPYKGTLPLKFKGRVAEGECRLVTRDALEAAAGKHLVEADAALAKAAASGTADPLASDPVGVDEALARPRGALTAAAALLGWDDPRVAARLAREAEVARALEASWAAAFDEARKGALGREWAPVAGGALQVRVTAVRCGPGLKAYAGINAFPPFREADACAANLAVRNTGDQQIETRFANIGPLERMVVLDRRGASHPVEVGGLWIKGRGVDPPFDNLLAPGREVEYVFLPDNEALIRKSRLPLLIRANDSKAKRPVFLDLGSP